MINIKNEAFFHLNTDKIVHSIGNSIVVFHLHHITFSIILTSTPSSKVSYLLAFAKNIVVATCWCCICI